MSQLSHLTQLNCNECNDCVICLDEIVESDLIKLRLCGHCYHKNCIKRWVTESPFFQSTFECPICRQTTKIEQIGEVSQFHQIFFPLCFGAVFTTSVSLMLTCNFQIRVLNYFYGKVFPQSIILQSVSTFGTIAVLRLDKKDYSSWLISRYLIEPFVITPVYTLMFRYYLEPNGKGYLSTKTLNFKNALSWFSIGSFIGVIGVVLGTKYSNYLQQSFFSYF